ncbi:type II/IV secretion system protein [Candidatus Microgenomates bacterium]|nr:type II/IV secretion system protein [Candidatus Microgenomates bacterium]
MDSNKPQTLADILLDRKVLTTDQANLVNIESINTGRAQDEVIISHHFAAKDQIAPARAQLLNVPFVSLVNKGISPEVLSFLPETVARSYLAIPFEYGKESNLLSVAMADPLNPQIIEFIEKKSNCKVVPYLAVDDDIKDAIDQNYRRGLTSEVTEALKEVAPQKRVIDIAKMGEIIREAPIAKIVSTILDYAVRTRASDVHLEPQEGRTRVRYRIDGILYERLALPKNIHEAVISRIKILSGMKIDEKRVPQDGRFNFKAGDQEVDLRVSTIPSTKGEKVVMRLLRKSGGVPTMPELGLRGLALKTLEVNILRPYGIILVCGPTGSGKTTTLYAVLSKLNTTKVNIVTLEDPVEYEIAGVNQVQINPVAGLTFANGLRAFLRQDPNIVLVGEIRDQETTGLAIQAALTGHLVFSTLHTNDAAGALPRLLDMGAESFLLASSMNAVVGQRICRKVCQSCKEPYDPPKEMADNIRLVLGNLLPKTSKDSGKVTLYRGKGCEECDNVGYFGRIGIFEVLSVSEKIGRLIMEHATADDIAAQAIKEGMITMKQDGYLKAMEGITTIEEVLRVAQD